jgi:hypothetical protein
MTKITVAKLVEQGRISARLYDECDTALAELNDAFGTPYENARKNLTGDLIKADASDIDLSVFQGEDSLFKFPEFQTNIIVRISHKPTAHAKLERIESEIEVLENKLKLAKLKRKNLIEELKLGRLIEFTTDKIVTAFSRIK